jgi:methenyltetrahydromethanopterin cyclohydrolase
MPTESAIELIASQCGVDPAGVSIAIAPSTSIAGSIQVVARSIETAMHKLHELKFDVTSIVSATGHAPLPPPAKPGDTVGGIGRTNDAMLYGAIVTLWVDADDDAIESVAAKVPSGSSSDHGQPFAEVFKRYKYDFYKVDPMLFSPAVVTIHNLRSGRTWTAGSIETEVLRRSFIG